LVSQIEATVKLSAVGPYAARLHRSQSGLSERNDLTVQDRHLPTPKLAKVM